MCVTRHCEPDLRVSVVSLAGRHPEPPQDSLHGRPCLNLCAPAQGSSTSLPEAACLSPKFRCGGPAPGMTALGGGAP